MRNVRWLPVLAVVSLAVSGCASGHRAGAPVTSMKGSDATPAVASPIALVRASWPIMRVFPSKSGATRRCLLPGPGISRGIKATCRTTFGLGAVGSQRVTFTETWPARLFRTSGSPKGTRSHSWQFAVDLTTGKVRLVVQHGDFPPQKAM
jgi:hypothetical protein